MTESQSKQVAIVAEAKRGEGKHASELVKCLIQLRNATQGTSSQIQKILPGNFKVVIVLALDAKIILEIDLYMAHGLDFIVVNPAHGGEPERGKRLKPDKEDGQSPKPPINQWTCSTVEQALQLADELVAGSLKMPGQPPPPPFFPEEQPPTIEDYEFPCPRPVGSGAAGVVWLAKHKWMRKLVALKLVRTGAKILEEEALARYCHLVSRHPDDFLPIFDPPHSLHDGTKRIYYATEPADCQLQVRFQDSFWYDPKTLASESGAHSAEETVRVTIKLLEQVSLLHKVGLVHGDIKPENVVFYMGQPRLIDVTLMGPIGPRSNSTGTPGFIDPELNGYPAGDVYSVGKVLYLLLIRKQNSRCPDTLAEDEKDKPSLSDIATLHYFEPLLFLDELGEVIGRACGVGTKRNGGKVRDRRKNSADAMRVALSNALELRRQELKRLEMKELKRRIESIRKDIGAPPFDEAQEGADES